MGKIGIVFYREGRYWVAQALNSDVSSFADTIDEARAAISEALELYFYGDGLGQSYPMTRDLISVDYSSCLT